jgi:5-methylcytosine-specific restriction endonuclease McrA
MKICWDTLEGIHLTRNGTFRKSGISYVYRGSCIRCGEPYLTPHHKQSKFCTSVCANIGKKRTKEQKRKMAIVSGKRRHSEATKKLLSKLTSGKNNSFFGKTHTIEAREKMSKSTSIITVGALNPNYRGGISMFGLTRYDAYKNTLGLYEKIRIREGTEILEVKCTYCGQWYAPTHNSVSNRITAINNLNQGECRLYCSENCKQACPTYGQVKYPKGFKHTSSREVSTYLRQIVLERDNWTCQICGKTILEIQLHVHHMDPVAQNPMFQNDMDSCITLCKGCHGMVHKQHGCRYIDLRCERIG